MSFYFSKKKKEAPYFASEDLEIKQTVLNYKDSPNLQEIYPSLFTLKETEIFYVLFCEKRVYKSV